MKIKQSFSPKNVWCECSMMVSDGVWWWWCVMVMVCDGESTSWGVSLLSPPLSSSLPRAAQYQLLGWSGLTSRLTQFTSTLRTTSWMLMVRPLCSGWQVPPLERHFWNMTEREAFKKLLNWIIKNNRTDLQDRDDIRYNSYTPTTKYHVVWTVNTSGLLTGVKK